MILMARKSRKPRKKTPFIRTRTVNVPKGYDYENTVAFKRGGKRKVGVAFSKKSRKLYLKIHRLLQMKLVFSKMVITRNLMRSEI